MSSLRMNGVSLMMTALGAGGPKRTMKTSTLREMTGNANRT